MNQVAYMEELKKRRIEYGISQEKLAALTGITRAHLNEIENGKTKPSEKLLETIGQFLESYNPDNPLEILFDYVRIRFPTTDVRRVAEELLHIRLEYMMHEDYAFYGYAEQYFIGDVILMCSPDEKKGVLLELKGKGCRQMERYLDAQNRNWFALLNQAVSENCIFKRIDLAINDRAGFLDIPKLTEKCNQEECISVFRSFKSYRSGELTRREEQYKNEMGSTLYIGSLKSEVYFCIYEKNYEQYIKNGIPIEEADIKNRFEIRLKNERAESAIADLLLHEDAGETAFGIINRYIQFVDRREGKRRDTWKINPAWEWFVGAETRKLRLTTQPEPYDFDNTLRWLAKQVAPTLKTIMEIDKVNHTSIIEKMLEYTQLQEHHEKLIKQQTVSLEELII